MPTDSMPPPDILDASPARDDSGADRGTLSRVPPRSLDARVAVLEDRLPRLEAQMKAGFEDLKQTCFLPILARQDRSAQEQEKLVREVEGVLNREKSVRWWVAKAVEKGAQLLSIAVFGYMWFSDSALAAKIAAWWFKIFF